jgi:hypothetical protein
VLPPDGLGAGTGFGASALPVRGEPAEGGWKRSVNVVSTRNATAADSTTIIGGMKMAGCARNAARPLRMIARSQSSATARANPARGSGGP